MAAGGGAEDEANATLGASLITLSQTRFKGISFTRRFLPYGLRSTAIDSHRMMFIRWEKKKKKNSRVASL
ncbi:hypothetical protein AMATHDRAFT_66210, partial [Amanita thiersii Skay4041]